ERHESVHLWPAFLTDGRRFIFLVESKDPSQGGLYLGSLASPGHTRLLDVRSNLGYAPGHLVYYRSGALMAQPFDEKNGRLSGDAIQVAEGIDYSPQYFRANFGMSQNGVLAYRGGGYGQGINRLTVFDRQGTVVETIGDVGNHKYPRFSPDGRRLLFSRGVLDSNNRTLFDVWQF